MGRWSAEVGRERTIIGESRTQQLAMQVKDLTTEEFKTLIRETVLEVLAESLDDPDRDLTLRPEIEQQLLAIRDRHTASQNRMSATDIAARYEMTWQ